MLPGDVAAYKGNNTNNQQWIVPKRFLNPVGVAFLSVNRSKKVPLSSMSNLLCCFEVGPGDPSTAARIHHDSTKVRSNVVYFAFFGEGNHPLYVGNLAHISCASLMHVLKPRLVVYAGLFYCKRKPTRALQFLRWLSVLPFSVKRLLYDVRRWTLGNHDDEVDSEVLFAFMVRVLHAKRPVLVVSTYTDVQALYTMTAICFAWGLKTSFGDLFWMLKQHGRALGVTGVTGRCAGT